MHRKTNVFLATRETLTIAPHVVMAAAENAALPAGKVGGAGDVIRDLPPALAARGVDVTVPIGVDGFSFDGTTPTDQADAFVATVNRALRCKREQRGDWRRIRSAASASRFSWDVAATHHIETVYGNR